MVPKANGLKGLLLKVFRLTTKGETGKGQNRQAVQLGNKIQMGMNKNPKEGRNSKTHGHTRKRVGPLDMRTTTDKGK